MAGGVNALANLPAKVDANNCLVVALEGPVSLTPFDQPPGLTWFDYTVARDSATGLPAVFNSDGSAFDVADLAPSGGGTYYVATTGNDTTGDGSEGNPWLTVNKFATTAPTNSTCLVAAGTYNVTSGTMIASATNKNLSVIGVGSVIISGHDNLTWTLNTGSTYVATQASASWVWDAATVDSYGDFAKLTLRGSIALVDANPGSYFISGNSVYVRTSDSRNLIGDTNIRVFVAQTGVSVLEDSTVYLENLTVHGGRPFVNNVGVGQTARLYLKNTTWKYRKNTGLSSTGGTTILQDSTFARMELDGLNYDNDAQGVGARTVEINVTSRDNGYDGGVTTNGSSMHGASTGVRVRGEYMRNVGPNVVDVGTAVTWNVGVWAHDSNSGVGTTSDSNFYSQALMWLDSVVSTGSTYSLVVDTASASEGLRVRNITQDGAISVVAGGQLLSW